MAGYLGTKAVLLSTTAADVIGNAEIGGDLNVGGNITSTGIDDNATSTAITIDSSQNVGIGTSSPSKNLEISDTLDATIRLTSTEDKAVFTADVNTYGTIEFYSNDASAGGAGIKSAIRSYVANTAGGQSNLAFSTSGSSLNDVEAMRIDSSGNLLVGTTDEGIYNSSSASGITLRGSLGLLGASRNSNESANFNRYGTDGDIVKFRKDGSTVGSIGVNGGYFYLAQSNTGILLDYGDSLAPSDGSGAIADNQKDVGHSANRWNDIYATNASIQTSDRNEKQDIEVLSDAEQRVAVACKGLLRKFRWKDAVAERGDDARIHFGIIAQDLQDAFTAEGLDAGRYAMFISSTWWETQTEVPAVEAVAAVYEDVVIPAVLDEEGNEVEPERTEQRLVTEAVEAKEAYTRTDTYETLEEAPEGATERTRLGVRYPELLAFIIGAM